jgi:hypothetical protein
VSQYEAELFSDGETLYNPNPPILLTPTPLLLMSRNRDQNKTVQVDKALKFA